MNLMMNDEETHEERATVRLTERDRHLVTHVARVRLLSTQQLGALMFPGRNQKNLEKRLLALAGLGAGGMDEPLLMRRTWRDYEGRRQYAWLATTRGQVLADRTA